VHVAAAGVRRAVVQDRKRLIFLVCGPGRLRAGTGNKNNRQDNNGRRVSDFLRLKQCCHSPIPLQNTDYSINEKAGEGNCP
jgi:hypothetical protein